MSLFNKDKKPTLKSKSAKTSKTNSNVKLTKYLPTSLFIGIKEDVNKKTLESYIRSLSQSLFNNPKEGKYSIKKLGKDQYIYEIHNGSNDLTYLPLVVSKLMDGSDREIILKTSGQNVRVVKKTATKIETNTLIESNNRDEDALIDYETKGKMIELVTTGTEFFLAASIFAGLTGFVASVSFLTKFYMLNEDYSYNPKIENHKTAIEFLGEINPEEHTETSYLEYIKFDKGEWKYNFKNIPKPEKILTEEELANGAVNVPKPAKVYDVVDANSNSFDSMVENNRKENEVINQPNNISNNVNTNNQFMNIEDTLGIETETKLENNMEIQQKEISTSVEASVVSPESTNPAIDSQPVNLDVNNVNNVNVEDSKGNEIDEFEILNIEEVNNLDISNLPDNVVVE